MNKETTLKQLHDKGLTKSIIVLDTYDFQKWCEEKHNMSNLEFISDVWGVMCNDFIDNEPYHVYQIIEQPKNKFEDLMNTFIRDFPEFQGTVNLMFTD